MWIESTQPLLEELLIATGGDGGKQKKCYGAIKEQGLFFPMKFDDVASSRLNWDRFFFVCFCFTSRMMTNGEQSGLLLFR